MAGISSKAINGVAENKRKYNEGTELESKEFIDGSGLEWYATEFRSYDSQIGRFIQPDPLAEMTFQNGIFVFALNNPISFNDPLGLTSDTTTLPEIVIFIPGKKPPKCSSCSDATTPSEKDPGSSGSYRWYEFFNDHNPGGDFLYEVNRFNPLANLYNGLSTWIKGQDSYGVVQDGYQGTAQVLSAFPWTRIATATTTVVQGATSRVVMTTVQKLQSKFIHAKDFGVAGNWNPSKGVEFLRQINMHMNHPATTIIAGAYRNSSKNVLFYLNPIDGRLVVTSLEGEFITAYKASQDQVLSIVERQFLW